MMGPEVERRFLKHFLAAIAYRTQKAVRDAPPEYWQFSAGNKARTPSEILRHMTSVLGYARTFFIGGEYPRSPQPLRTPADEIERFHEILNDLGRHVGTSLLKEITEQQLLQGPFADVMTHVGQLALLRRLHGSPVPPENFIFADIDTDRLHSDQPTPLRPDQDWPERPES